MKRNLTWVAQVLGPVIQGTHFRIGQLLLLLVICIRWVPSELFQAGQNYLTWFKLCFGVSPIDLLFVCFLTLVKYYVTTWIYCHFMFWPDFISISMCIYDVVYCLIKVNVKYRLILCVWNKNDTIIFIQWWPVTFILFDCNWLQ